MHGGPPRSLVGWWWACSLAFTKISHSPVESSTVIQVVNYAKHSHFQASIVGLLSVKRDERAKTTNPKSQ